MRRRRCVVDTTRKAGGAVQQPCLVTGVYAVRKRGVGIGFDEQRAHTHCALRFQAGDEEGSSCVSDSQARGHTLQGRELGAGCYRSVYRTSRRC
jgi:hypothetical protein